MKLLITVLFSLFAIWGAGAEINWLDKKYDFGLINEEDGPVTGYFAFVNIGKKAVKISEVTPACGCTGVEYPTHKITRGDTAVIKVTFNPEDRPGKFEKSITVYIEKERHPVELIIEGTVLASPSTLSLFYPVSFGSIYSDISNVDFEEMKPGMRRRRFVDLYNASQMPVTLSVAADSEALNWDMESNRILPGEGTTLTIYLDASKVGWPGQKLFHITLVTDNDRKIDLPVTAIVQP